jgi:hypothetical protein
MTSISTRVASGEQVSGFAMFWFRSGIRRAAPSAAGHIVSSGNPKKFRDLELVYFEIIDLSSLISYSSVRPDIGMESKLT